jgi:hypothetical protein
MLPGESTTTKNADIVQGLEKTIPDSPKNVTPVHLRNYQYMADTRNVLRRGEKDVGILKDGTVVGKDYGTGTESKSVLNAATLKS